MGSYYNHECGFREEQGEIKQKSPLKYIFHPLCVSYPHPYVWQCNERGGGIALAEEAIKEWFNIVFYKMEIPHPNSKDFWTG